MRSIAVDYIKKIEDLARPFVEAGLYSSAEEFFREVVASLTNKRIKAYERAVKRFESKYEMRFEEFTKRSKNNASPQMEDDWMEWEASLNMLHAWKKAGQEIGLGAA